MEKACTYPDLVSAARAAWPDVVFREDDFAAFVAARSPSIERAGDLLVAFASAAGDPLALAILEREYLARLPALLSSRLGAEAAEVVQMVRERMLVPDASGTPARIASYAGRGALLGWLRVAAVRLALNLQRSRRREVPFDEDVELAQRASGDLAMDDLKRRYRTEFKEAFGAALAALAPRERLLLRQHYLDRLPMETIGRLHQVHRITIVRWMDAARVALARETRRELGARLRIDHEELESILRLLESQMDMSIRAFLD